MTATDGVTYTMKAPHHTPPLPNPAPRSARRHSATAALVLSALLPLTGCIRTRLVAKTVVAPHVLDATLDQLVERLSVNYAQVQSMSASVEIFATSGGEHRGEVKELPSFSGYIIERKPQDLHLLMLVPVIRSRALEMVSDGKTFRLFIPSKNKAVEGSDTPPAAQTQPVPVPPPAAPKLATPGTPAAAAETQNASLYNLRPYIIRDALLIPPLGTEEYVTLTESSRVTPGKNSRESTEEPDYDLTILRTRMGHTLQRERVIHFGRLTLEPYRQDIYDAEGRLVTMVEYANFQKTGDVSYPMSILIKRPLDEYSLRLSFSKVSFNQKVDDEQFMLKIPDNIPIQKM